VEQKSTYKIIVILLCIGIFFSPFQPIILADALNSTEITQPLIDEMAFTTSGDDELTSLNILSNFAALQTETENAIPTVLSDPLSIVRMQSAYRTLDTIGNSVVVTFTVTNNQRPSVALDLPESNTITETITAVSTHNPLNDPNTIRNVLLTDAFTANATFTDSSPPFDFDGVNYAWNLGDIPPLGQATLTMTLTVSEPGGDFADLDTGAVVWGTLAGRSVTAVSQPAQLVNNGIGDWLQRTPDADIYDDYMLRETSLIGQDPLALFAYVRDLDYEAYEGSLRGTRGTLWSQAGNAPDQSSLLIAMLRSAGIPARYRHGVLSQTNAQVLIQSMFLQPTQVVGKVDESNPYITVSDPLSDPDLLAIAADHWWVEAYLPGSGWTNLDPSFATAVSGQTFHDTLAVDGTDQIAELPDTLRHTVIVKIETENYQTLANANGSTTTTTPLSHTFNTVDIVGRPLALHHTIQETVNGGAFFVTRDRSYVPYLIVGDYETAVEGQPFQEFFSNFPFGQQYIISEWLVFDVQAPSGESETYRREIADRIGFENRVAGAGEGHVDFTPDETPIVNSNSVYMSHLLMGKTDPLVYSQQIPKLLSLAELGIGAYGASQAENLFESPEAHSSLQPFVRESGRVLMGLAGTVFALKSDGFAQLTSEAMLVKNYTASPRIVINSMVVDTDAAEVEFNSDILKNNTRAIPYPGQNEDVLFIYQGKRGNADSLLEAVALSSAIQQRATSAWEIYETALRETGGDLRRITPYNLDVLDELPISIVAKGRIQEVVLNHNVFVLVPAQMVQINGEETIAWQEVASDGTTIMAHENGLHSSLVSTAMRYMKKVDEQRELAALTGYVTGLFDQIASSLTAVQFAVSGASTTGTYGFAQWFTEAVDSEIPACQKNGVPCISKDDVRQIILVQYISDIIGFATMADTHLNGFPNPLDGMKGFWMNVFSAFAVSLAKTLVPYILSIYMPPSPPDWAPTLVNMLIGTFIDVIRAVIEDALGKGITYLPTATEFGQGYIIGKAVGFATTSIVYLFALSNIDPAIEEGYISPIPDRSLIVPESLVIDVPATHTEQNISANLQTGNLFIAGETEANWVSSAQHIFAFETLTNTQATVYDGSGSLLGTGFITATSTISQSTAVFNPTTTATHLISGNGSHSLYAPALSGLGVGQGPGHYGVTLSAADTTHLAVANSHISIDGTEYTGDFTLELSGTTAVTATIPSVPNFITGVTQQLQNGRFSTGSSAGTFEVNGASIDVSNGVAVADYTGDVIIAEADSNTDALTAAGNANFFTMALNPTAVSAVSGESITFQSIITANFTDSYTVTATAPDGWQVQTDDSGYITATIPLGTPPQDNYILVVAQSHTHPDLFVSAIETVTSLTAESMSMELIHDPLLAVPWQPMAEEPFSIPLRDGAFQVNITNTATSAHTYEVTVDTSSLPAAEWLLLTGQEPGETTTTIALPPGGKGQVGLYIFPEFAALPASGTNYPFAVTITAVDNPALTQTEAGIFTLPAIPYSILTLEAMQYATPSTTTNIPVTVHSAGNSAVDVSFNVIKPSADWVESTPLTPITLNSGASSNQILGLDVPSDAQVGENYPVYIYGLQPGDPITHTLRVATVRVVSPNLYPLYEAGAEARRSFPDDIMLSVVLEQLVDNAELFELSCLAGDCDLELRDRLVDSITAVSSSLVPAISTDLANDFQQLADQMANHTDDADLMVDLGELATLGEALLVIFPAIAEHGLALSFNPGVTAVLNDGSTVNTALFITNHGALATTAVLTLTTPAGFTTSWNNQSITLQPNETITVPTTITPNAGSMGFYTVSANATAQENSLVKQQTEVGIHIVDAFVQVLNVAPNPAFVETGVSSSTLTVDIANVANIFRPANAVAEIYAENGSLIWNDTIAIEIPTGEPRSYAIGTVDTSGWAAGVYTVTVALHDEADTLIPNGTGYGYLGVGQGLTIQHNAAPIRVPLGTAVVTTTITTEFETGAWNEEPAAAWGQTAVSSDLLTPLPESSSENIEYKPETTVEGLTYEQSEPSEVSEAPESTELSETPSELISSPDTQFINSYRPAAANSAGLTRIEANNPAIQYNGSWGFPAVDRASGDESARSRTLGDTAVYTFTGTTAIIGFLTASDTGMAEIFMDGVSQGIVDTYGRHDEVMSHRYSVITGTHTISITVLDQRNSNSSSDWVYIDYIDTWDDTPLVNGRFEQDDARVFISDKWGTGSNSAASGGSYISTYQNDNAWFHFTGDSITYQPFMHENAGEAELYIDGEFKGFFDLYSATSITGSISFDGLGSGVHMMRVNSYRSHTTVDAFITPGTAPFYQPPSTNGVFRYEENNTALLYNGLPYNQTTTSWSGLGVSRASAAYVARSATLNDSVSLTFDGSWVNIGFTTATNAGKAEIFIDGASQGVVDTYGHHEEATSQAYNLASGTHTIDIVVLDQRNSNSSSDWVYIDYIDTWDDTPLVNGRFEQDDARVFISDKWGTGSNSAASGGSYISTYQNDNAWFHFTGDSITYQPFMHENAGEAELYIDGEFKGFFDLYSATSITGSISFDGLGSGVHMMRVNSYRSHTTVDAFITPGTAPFYQPPSTDGMLRYEENHPAILYNGVTYNQTATSWTRSTVARLSGGAGARTTTVNDTISLTFDGQWVSPGFLATTTGGQAEIFIDGVSQGIIDTYSGTEDVITAVYSNLTPGNHTLSIVALSSRIYLDYIDVWGGTDMPAALFEAEIPRTQDSPIYISDDWGVGISANALQGTYLKNGTNSWFLFTGDNVTYLAMTNATAGVEVFIDGISRGNLDLSYPFAPGRRTFLFDGLGDGAHVMRIAKTDRATVDGFDTSPIPSSSSPAVEWYSTVPGGKDGVFSTIASGDVNNDGLTEMVLTSNNSDGGKLFVFRGDGADAGMGSPIIWMTDTVGVEPEAPAIGDIDGLPGAEIVVSSQKGVSVFHGDGSLYWFTDTIKTDMAGGPAIGNLDDDPRPEIVIGAGRDIAVFTHDGHLAWTYRLPSASTPPILADMNGDGYLDILVAALGDQSVYLLDYDQGNTPTLAWSQTVASSMSNGRGAPAVADVDSLQPGGDEGPEIVIASNGFVNILDADGTPLNAYPVPTGVPGGISIADTDGDGEVEIVTSMMNSGGQTVVLNADGSILWQAPALDSTSGTSSSVLDMDGDGQWEVIWNGYDQGLTIYRGNDGAILFNDHIINSITRRDFPIIADVDNDGHAEILAGDREGVYVVGLDDVWTGARSIWNEYNYHITNVGDDLSIPTTEPNSWEYHNTYRTQSPLLIAAPVYQIALTHTVDLVGVEVLSNTFSMLPNTLSPAYQWQYQQYWYQGLQEIDFQSNLSAMQAGEVRQLNQGTEAAYTSAGGSNHLYLPPLYVVASHLLDITPAAQAVNGSKTAVYQIQLKNESETNQVMTVSVVGIPAGWLKLPEPVSLSAGSVITVPLAITPPSGTAVTNYPFNVIAATNNGGFDQVRAGLNVVTDTFAISVSPDLQLANNGESVTFTVTISNFVDADIATQLGYSFLQENDVMLPAPVTIPASGSISLTIPVTPTTVSGQRPFTVQATNTTDGRQQQDDAALLVFGAYRVAAMLSPIAGVGGSGTPVTYTLSLTNMGTALDAYDIDITLPAGWSYQLLANEEPVSSLMLTPHLFNEGELLLVVVPPVGTVPATYPVSAHIQSRSMAGVTAVANANLIVTERGVQVNITPDSVNISPLDSFTWQVTITNSGSVADSYDLTAGGIIAGSASFSPSSVSLAAGQAQTVQMSSADMDFALAQTYQFEVMAQSQNDSHIRNSDTAEIIFDSFEAVTLTWVPVEQTVTDSYNATFMLYVTNKGNVSTVYDLSLLAPGLQVEADMSSLYLLPHTTAGILVGVTAVQNGTYTLTGQADANGGTASATEIATLTIDTENPTSIVLQQFNVENHPVSNRLLLSVFTLLLLIIMTGVVLQRRKSNLVK